jgi:hypothetical protein
MLESLTEMATTTRTRSRGRRARGLLACALAAVIAGFGAAGAAASTGARVHVGSRTVTVSGSQISAGGDVSATYTLRSGPGQSQPITLHGMSIRALLGAAGIDPGTVTSVTVGGATPLSPIDIADPPPFAQGPALITVNGSTTRYFRPVRGPGDINVSDYITTPPGEPIDVTVEGPIDTVATTSSHLQVTASAAPTEARVSQTVSFAALIGNPPAGVELSYSWSFGDGASAFGVAPSHSYSVDGDYPATVTVSGPGVSGVSSVVVVHVGNPKRRSSGSGLGNSTASGSGAGGTGNGKGGTGGGSATGGKGATQPQPQAKPTVKTPAQSVKPAGAAKAQAARVAAGGHQVVHGILLAAAGSPFDLKLSPPPPAGGAGAAHKSRGGSTGAAAVVVGLALALAIATLGGLTERRRGTLSPA